LWIEGSEMTLCVRLADDNDPANHTIDITTEEQVFTPVQRYQASSGSRGSPSSTQGPASQCRSAGSSR
jgi:hypothetical protein